MQDTQGGPGAPNQMPEHMSDSKGILPKKISSIPAVRSTGSALTPPSGPPSARKDPKVPGKSQK